MAAITAPAIINPPPIGDAGRGGLVSATRTGGAPNLELGRSWPVFRSPPAAGSMARRAVGAAPTVERAAGEVECQAAVVAATAKGRWTTWRRC